MADANHPATQAEGRDTAGRFLPGVSGNPEGMKTGTVSLRARLRQRLQLEGKAGADLADELLDELIAIALRRRKMNPKTRLDALTFLFEQLEGRAHGSVDVIDPRQDRIEGYLQQMAAAMNEDEAPDDGPAAS